MIEGEINVLLKDEEIMWKQRSTMEWLQARDRSTTFFRNKTFGRRQRNKIECIHNENLVEDETEIEEIIIQYSRDIFSSLNSTDVDYILNSVEPYIKPNVAAFL